MTDKRLTSDLPAAPDSYWLDSTESPRFTPLDRDLSVQAVIVGGGITGVTAAYLLAREGVKVALLEADRLFGGTTGHTTAKLTAQHDLTYHELMEHMGRPKARLYHDANMAALKFVQRTVRERAISCDFELQDSWIYATSDATARQLEQEARAYDKLGIDGELVDRIPFDIKVKQALRMPGQAQFHPLRYLQSLLREAVESGALIFEETLATDVEYGLRPTVVTRSGHRITADRVLTCTHFPFYDGPGFYFARMHAERSYVVAAQVEQDYPGGMYITPDTPTRSLRSARWRDQSIVLFGGEGHKTGQGVDTLAHYAALEAFGRDLLGIREILYRWSAQDLVTLDKVPYIGAIAASHPHVLVATGYRKWGMTTGTAAAQLLCDLVQGRENPYKELYAPSRFYVDPSLKRFFAQSADVAGHLLMGKLELPLREPDDLARGEGDVVSCDGVRAGAYRDEDGRLHVVDTTCTHMGCEVSWNHGDHTWDCPCHGSRFSIDGEVVEGPAKKPLPKLM